VSDSKALPPIDLTQQDAVFIGGPMDGDVIKVYAASRSVVIPSVTRFYQYVRTNDQRADSLAVFRFKREAIRANRTEAD
jgi:hypothetical protein